MEDANSEVEFLFSKKAGEENWWNSIFSRLLEMSPENMVTTILMT